MSASMEEFLPNSPAELPRAPTSAMRDFEVSEYIKTERDEGGAQLPSTPNRGVPHYVKIEDDEDDVHIHYSRRLRVSNYVKMEEDEDDVYVPPAATGANSFPVEAHTWTSRRLNANQQPQRSSKFDRNTIQDMIIVSSAAGDGPEDNTDSSHRQGFAHSQDLDRNHTWQPPTDGTLAAMGNLALVNFYSNCCKVIWKAWGCDVENCIPEAMRDSTSFSFALLLKLRQFAKKTKNQLSVAHGLLTRVQSLRIAKIRPLDNPHFVYTRFGHNPHCEESVLENVFGLMIEDVEPLLKAGGVKLAKNDASQARKIQKRPTLHPKDDPVKIAEQQASIAARVTKRRRMNDIERIAANMTDLTILPSRLQHIADHDAPAIPPELREAFDLIRSAEGTQQQENSVKFSLRNGVAKLGDDLASFQIEDGGKGIRPKRRRKLEAGGISRAGKQGDLRMPSERYDLNSVPTLFTTTAATSPDEFQRLGQLPLPG